MKNYELLVIVPAKVTDKEIPAVSEKITKIISQEGGQITLEDFLGRKKLSFPIKKNEVGSYLLFEITGNSDLNNKLEKIFKLTPEILRYMIIVDPPTKEESTPKTPVEKKPEIKKPATAKSQKESKEKISLEDLDEKLDNILEDNILK